MQVRQKIRDDCLRYADRRVCAFETWRGPDQLRLKRTAIFCLEVSAAVIVPRFRLIDSPFSHLFTPVINPTSAIGRHAVPPLRHRLGRTRLRSRPVLQRDRPDGRPALGRLA